MDVTMPQLGETVTEGTITRWFKQVGEKVEADEPLFEVSTDKVDSEVPAPQAGFVSEILVPEGDTVPVGARLAVISDAAGARPRPPPRPRPRPRRAAGARAGARAAARTRRPPPAPAGAAARAARRRRRHPRPRPRRARRTAAAPVTSPLVRR